MALRYRAALIAPLLILGAEPALAQSDNRIFLNAGVIETGAGVLRGNTFTDSSERRLHLVQFAGPIQPSWVAALTEAGLEIAGYIPENAYLVYAADGQLTSALNDLASAGALRWNGQFIASHKMHPSAQQAMEQAISAKQLEVFAIQLFRDDTANRVTRDLIDSFTDASVLRDETVLRFRNIVASCHASRLSAIAARPDVISIQSYPRPRQNDERQAQIMAGALNGNGPAGPGYLGFLASKGFDQAAFSASNFVVDVSDSGIDNATVAPNHPNLFVLGSSANLSRVAYSRLEGTPNTGSTLQGRDGHGTLNAHIIAGYHRSAGFPHTDAAGYRFGLGLAPFVRVGSSVIFDPEVFTYPNFAHLASRAWRDGARISSNSWNADVGGAYNIDAQAYDALVRDAAPASAAVPVAGNQQMVMLFAAGNRGPYANTIGAPGTAKNVITVGAAESVQPFGGSDGCNNPDAAADNVSEVATFSSRGPTDDGRIKPDILAPGTHISGGIWQAPNPASNGTAAAAFDGRRVCGGPDGLFFPPGQQLYTASSGTSHACAAVAGAAALLRQDFINKGLQPPSPALTKAAFAATSRYMTGAGAADTLPSNSQGAGAVNLAGLFDGAPRYFRDQKAADKFTATGQSRTFTLIVTDSSKPMRIVLAWTDAPGSTAGAAYNNNLDLSVAAGGNLYLGNVFAGAWSSTGGQADSRNNLESVVLPPGFSGPVQVTISAANINSDAVPGDSDALDQDFALYAGNTTASLIPDVVAGGARLTSESFSPVNGLPDSAERVTFDFALTNLGALGSGPIVATLVNSGNVTSATGPQVYGPIAPGQTVTRPFSFTVSGNANAASGITATLELVADGAAAGTITYELRVARPATVAPAAAVRLISEGFTPPNNLPDVGEVVTVELTLRNIGDRWFNNLEGSLAAITPVTFPSGAQTFGNLAPGQAAKRTFTFTVDGTPGQTHSLLLNLQDGVTPYPAVSFPDFRLARAASPVIEAFVLTSESAMPANGWPDQGEVVTAALTLRNAGETALQSLGAQLLAANGVNAPLPDGAQSFGVLPGGGSATRSFTFTGGAPCGAEVRAKFALMDSGASLGSADHLWFLGATTTTSFLNSAPIVIPDQGPAALYPSLIEVAGLNGNVIKARARLHQFGHTWPDDLDILLVGPANARTILLSDSGGGEAVSNVELMFDDAAAGNLPNESQLPSGTFKPTNYPGADTDAFSDPAPAGLHPSVLTVFRGTPANGPWKLFVKDSFVGDAGSIAGGWELWLETTTGTGCHAVTTDLAAEAVTSPALIAVNQPRTVAFRLSNRSTQPASGVTLTCPLPSGINYSSAWISQGSVTYAPGENTVRFEPGYVFPGSEVIATLQFVPTTPGTKQISGALTLLQSDSFERNNHPMLSFTVDADSDGDGMPDSFETMHGFASQNPSDAAADNDGDGKSNYAEYLSGTSPLDARSTLRITSITRTTVSFNSVPGRLYQLQSCSDIAKAEWTTLRSNVLATSTTTTLLDTNPSNVARTFYRILPVP